MEGNNTRSIFRTPFMVMIRNLVVVYAVFLLCHIIFIWYNWNSLQGTMQGMIWPMLKGSLVFDTAGIMYLCAIYMVLLMFPLHFKEKKWFYRLTKIIQDFQSASATCVWKINRIHQIGHNSY